MDLKTTVIDYVHQRIATYTNPNELPEWQPNTAAVASVTVVPFNTLQRQPSANLECCICCDSIKNPVRYCQCTGSLIYCDHCIRRMAIDAQECKTCKFRYNIDNNAMPLIPFDQIDKQPYDVTHKLISTHLISPYAAAWSTIGAILIAGTTSFLTSSLLIGFSALGALIVPNVEKPIILTFLIYTLFESMFTSSGVFHYNKYSIWHTLKIHRMLICNLYWSVSLMFTLCMFLGSIVLAAYVVYTQIYLSDEITFSMCLYANASVTYAALNYFIASSAILSKRIAKFRVELQEYMINNAPLIVKPYVAPVVSPVVPVAAEPITEGPSIRVIVPQHTTESHISNESHNTQTTTPQQFTYTTTNEPELEPENDRLSISRRNYLDFRVVTSLNLLRFYRLVNIVSFFGFRFPISLNCWIGEQTRQAIQIAKHKSKLFFARNAALFGKLEPSKCGVMYLDENALGTLHYYMNTIEHDDNQTAVGAALTVMQYLCERN
jgi:hypothetical protein